MAPYHIRPYQDQDWEAVRQLFSEGMHGNLPSDFRALLKKPRALLVLLGAPLALLWGSGSPLLALLAFAAVLAAQWLTLRHFVGQYVRSCLRADLLDIRKAYLRGRGCGFWVAEAERRVVGTVGVRLAREPVGAGSYLELFRLSVKSALRGRGVARALVQTVLRFARDQGFDGVVLETSSANRPARRLYESAGFRKSRETRYFLAWWFGFFTTCHFQCDFSSPS
ncbi:N-acetyltransferase 8-like [Antechinus flavipes]|uniref:N-acetyltransferase 8-like n=1 Tax=Antechinus flavipes TaxID=38775 RepID=UPI002235CF91|nr:N-acetyltransferase 8-like [Antechinus flavipes]